MMDDKKLIDEKTKDYPSIKPKKVTIIIRIILSIAALALAGVALYFLVFYR
ncbi:MAG: hypothetical protein MJ221_01350 [Bacilli bacterium]|nr:hypothetical protein [Bacilli bacterium]